MKASPTRFAAALTLAVLVSGCVSNQTPRQRDKIYPVGWPDIAEVDSSCVALSGTYANEGTVTDKDGAMHAITLASLLPRQPGNVLPLGFAKAKVISLRVVTSAQKTFGREVNASRLQFMADYDQSIQVQLGPFPCGKRGLLYGVDRGFIATPIGFGGTGTDVELSKAVDGSLLARVMDTAAGVLLVVPLYHHAYNWARFTRVAEDVPRDPATLHRMLLAQPGTFVVQAKSPPNAAPAAGHAPGTRTARLVEVTDRRPDTDHIGARHAAFGVPMGDVYFSRDVAGYMRETLEREVIAAGFRLAEKDADLNLTCEVNKFWLHTPATIMYWDVIADLSIVVVNLNQASPQRREFSATASRRTYFYPSASLCGTVIEDCTDKLMAQLREDPSWR